MTDMSAHVTSERIAPRPNAGGTLRLLALLLLVWAVLAAVSWFAPYLDTFGQKSAPPPAVIDHARPAPVVEVVPEPVLAPEPPRARRAPAQRGVRLDAPHSTAPAEEFDVLSASELDAISQDRSAAP